jgi:hypothetical protein
MVDSYENLGIRGICNVFEQLLTRPELRQLKGGELQTFSISVHVTEGHSFRSEQVA